jgi:hypothetical protein
MNVVIVMRSCPDYDKLDNQSFAHQFGKRFILSAELKACSENDVLKVWSKVFALPYLMYRKELAKIASSAHNATGLKTVRGEEEFLPWYENTSSDDIVVPVDDDDWFRPDISRIAEQFDECTNLVYWRKITFKNYNSCKIYSSFRFRLASNNWAIRKSWLDQQGVDRAQSLILGSHVHAEKYVVANMNMQFVKGVDECWSIYNRHCGSLALLQAFCKSGTLIESLKEIAKRSSVPIVLQSDIKWWAQPHVEKIYKLNANLRRKLIC